LLAKLGRNDNEATERQMQAGFDLGLEDARFSATIAHDIDAMQACLRDDFTFIHSSGRIDDKQSYLDLLGSGELRYLKMDWRDMRVLARIGPMTQVFSRLDFTADLGGRDVAVSAYIVSTWIEEGGAWRVLTIQSSGLPQGSH
jgi:hypothetical protein